MKTETSLTKWLRAGFLGLTIATVGLGTGFAHDGMEDIAGTIQSLGANSVSVKTTKGKTVEVTLDAKTEFTRGKQQAKQVDLKVGERVVIHAMEMNKQFTAHLIQLQTGASKTK